MSDFHSMKEEIDRIKKDISNAVSNLPQYSAQERPSKMQKIEARFGEFDAAINELDLQALMFDVNDKNAAKKYLVEVRNEYKKLQNEYTDAKRKGSERDALFGGAVRSDGSSTGQMQSLYDQQNIINEGDNLTTELGRSVAQGHDAGVNILGELANQRNKITHIDDELNSLDTDVDTGNSIIDRMICRNTRRTIFMIILIIILLIASGVFLYFIFKPAK
ncbi:Vesicle transport v-SNARE protein [Trichomonas vaginalis G3]|uniref:Vesicle transport v-SNARE protein n=1 Tax=Trichomonas vaginalis (strain ATCC PRA-98 / G3) TaxID=412133 RepID=A2E5L8_TRIV3|nr:vesicle transport V-SNARE 13 family [Trichomonas vaginalis G3]EAY12059.1 Vesicle transport v-SNARE protein [Trichomonas vaginalis G3]KAI5553257.1 vesicle transport V-SNARE 13 family [Trichomonas vaginalis G3]|eukprot:XP_001324282.1 Vesicle transport v-SNARE protein [Trichomonas vaginalis G3]